MGDRAKLPYCCAAITEAQRHLDRFGMNLTRCARQNMIIGEHKIIAGSLLYYVEMQQTPKRCRHNCCRSNVRRAQR